MINVLMRWVVVLSSLFATAACTHYGQVVRDEQLGLLYLTYTKSFMGISTGGGVLECVPAKDGLKCVDRIDRMAALPCPAETSEAFKGCDGYSGSSLPPPPTASPQVAAATVPSNGQQQSTPTMSRQSSGRSSETTVSTAAATPHSIDRLADKASAGLLTDIQKTFLCKRFLDALVASNPSYEGSRDAYMRMCHLSFIEPSKAPFVKCLADMVENSGDLVACTPLF